MYARLNPAIHESFYDAIGRWTASAPAHLLRVIFWSGLLGALGVVIVDPGQWYISMGMGAQAALGARGLLQHRRSAESSPALQVLEGVVAAIALVAALVALLVGLFVFLGPAPHF